MVRCFGLACPILCAAACITSCPGLSIPTRQTKQAHKQKRGAGGAFKITGLQSCNPTKKHLGVLRLKVCGAQSFYDENGWPKPAILRVLLGRPQSQAPNTSKATARGTVTPILDRKTGKKHGLLRRSLSVWCGSRSKSFLFKVANGIDAWETFEFL